MGESKFVDSDYEEDEPFFDRRDAHTDDESYEDDSPNGYKYWTYN